MYMNMPGMGNLGDTSQIVNKLGDKIQFPASKGDVSSALDKVDDIPGPAKQMVKEKLPDKQFSNLDDIKSALGMN